MYGRKQSTAGIDPGTINLMQSAGGLGGAAGGPPFDYGVDEAHGEGSEVIWSSRNGPRKFLRFLSLLSLLSVMVNTPKQFEKVPSLRYVTYCVDIVCLIFFVAEMVTKIKHMGLLGTEKAYFRDRWSTFDGTMAFFILISVLLQTFELCGASCGLSNGTALSMLRAPRPLIMIRFIRGLINFSMPKNRLAIIMRRSSQQIYNVTIFYIFFMCFYGLWGVQLFGELNYHCVRKGVPAELVTKDDLTIPDSYCNPGVNRNSSKENNSNGHKCPPNFECMKLSKLGKQKLGFIGFGNFFTSLFSVYTAASQEGWVYIMYRAADSTNKEFATLYFWTLIFFLAWMVRNVFIAVITETFNEIRVQFQEMWGDRERITGETSTQVLEGDKGNHKAWKLVTVYENRHLGWAPEFCQKFLRSSICSVIISIVTLTNAVVTSCISFKHDVVRHHKDGTPYIIEADTRDYFFKPFWRLEIGFTLFYNLEVLFKIFCLGWRGYISQPMQKFELLLAIMTTIHIIPGVFLSPLSIFQVARVVRLFKISPMLEDFVYKIFGPGLKLGSVLMFTMCLLVVMGSISMQLFCHLECDTNCKFDMFPNAFFSMFQILTQEAWPEVMGKTMEKVPIYLSPFVALYFIFYHLFVTLIVMSLFVAVILDNLELTEEAKKIKQLKLREESSDIKEELPLRLRVFEKFPERPLMTRLHRIPSDFSTPKVRDSFVSKFVYETEDAEDDDDPDVGISGSTPGLPPGGGMMGNHIPSNIVGGEGGAGGNYGLRYRKNVATTSLLSSPTRKIQKAQLIKKSAVSNIIASVQRSIRGGSQLFKQRGVSYRLNENVKENGVIPGMGGGVPSSGHHNNPTGAVGIGRRENVDIKLLHAKKQQAEMRRNQKEEDLRENHPFFDRPLFAVPRESTFRKICQAIVGARYDGRLKDPNTGKERKVRFKTLHKMLGLVTYLDWVMIFVTCITCISMMFETPRNRVMDNTALQVTDYIFVIAMGCEITLKVLAEGLLFTPKALIKDISGVLDIFIFAVSLIWLCWMPKDVKPNSLAHFLMLLRCCRPLRILILVPHMRRVVSELCKGFKEILLVGILLLVLIFVFASWGVHLFGMKFAACNDQTITRREDCVGTYRAEVFITKMNVEDPRNGCPNPGILVPRVWHNPRRFHFDNIGRSMLALFEVLSFKGWVDLRDVIILKMGHHYAIFIHIYIFLGSMIGLTLFVGVVIANYRENRGTALLTVDQMRWSDLKKRLKIAQPLHVPPKPENSKFQAFIYDIVQHLYFKRFVAILVLANSFLLSIKWEPDDDDVDVHEGTSHEFLLEQDKHCNPSYSKFKTLFDAKRNCSQDPKCVAIEDTSCNNKGSFNLCEQGSVQPSPIRSCIYLKESNEGGYFDEFNAQWTMATASSVLTICFLIEVIMKMIAFTPYGYWQSRRNRMDFMVTLLGVIWIVLNYTFNDHVIVILGYVVILLRFCTITGKHSTLTMLIQTVIMSIYKSFFIIMLMFLMITCYALAGNILFGNVKYGEAINRHANFDTTINGIQMLFRIVTGEDWNRVLHDAMLYQQCTRPKNANYWETDCGNWYMAIIFFCTFYVLITYIVLNLLVAIIMENFSLFYSNEEDAMLSNADIRNFQNTWNIVDVNQRGMIPVRRVKFILRLLKGRLEVDPQKDRLLFKHMCYELERLHNGEDVTFHDVLSMLSYRSVDIRKALQLEELLAREELEYIIEEEVAKITIRKWLDGCLKRIREKEQSLIAGLRAMNEPVMHTLRPLEENEKEDEEDEDDNSSEDESKVSSDKKEKEEKTNEVISQQPTQTVTVNQDKLSTVVESTQRKLSDVGQRHVLTHQPTAVSLTSSPPPPSLKEIEPSSHSPDNFNNENEEVRKDFDTLASPPSNATTGNSGGNNPIHDHPANSSKHNSNNANKPALDRQQSDSIISTNSSISVVSGSNKTNSEVSGNRTLKNSEQLTNGKNSTRSNSKSKSSNRTLSPKSPKLHTAECPIGSITPGLYNSNPNDSSTTTDAEGSPNVSEMVQTSGNGDSNTTTTMIGLISTNENVPRKNSMTNIAKAAITPIMSIRNNSITNKSSPNTENATLPSSMNGKHTEDGSTNRNSKNLIFNMDKGPQQMVVSPPSPSMSQKGDTSYNNPSEIDVDGVNNSMPNNNYLPTANPNSLMARGHGVSATQLTGVKNWWKNQMEYYSSDEEW